MIKKTKDSLIISLDRVLYALNAASCLIVSASFLHLMLVPTRE